MKTLISILVATFCLFILTVVIYWFNLDMKLIRVVYDWLWENRYDKMKRDRKL